MTDTNATEPTLDVQGVLNDIDEMCRKTIPDLAVLMSPDVDGMCQLLQLLRIAAAQMRWAIDGLEDEIVKVMPGKQVEVAGLGVVEMKTGASRKAWDKDALVSRLVSRIGDDPEAFVDVETGEFLPPAEVADRVIKAFLLAATPSWKVTGLRAFMIDPDEYCETTWGRKTIQTPKVEPWAATQGDNS